MQKFIAYMSAIVFLTVSFGANASTAYPSSVEEIRNLSDEELIQVVERYRTELYPIALTIWRPLQTQYGISTVEDFKTYFPSTWTYLEKKLNASSANSALGAELSTNNLTGGLTAIGSESGLVFVGGFLALVGLNALLYRESQRAKDALEARIAEDLIRQNPEWQDSDLQEHLSFWSELLADEVIRENGPFGSSGVLAFEIRNEAKRRGEALRKMCADASKMLNEFPSEVVAFCQWRLPELFEGDCPDFVSSHVDSQASPYMANKNSQSGSPDVGMTSQQQKGGGHCTGTLCSGSPVWVVDGPDFEHGGGGPGGGVPPGTPGTDIEPPGPGCVGPCCDGRPGEAPGGPGDDQRCFVDGNYIPCSHAF